MARPKFTAQEFQPTGAQLSTARAQLDNDEAATSDWAKDFELMLELAGYEKKNPAFVTSDKAHFETVSQLVFQLMLKSITLSPRATNPSIMLGAAFLKGLYEGRVKK